MKIIELTSVEPAWLLHGKGPKFATPGPVRHDAASPPAMTVGALLRTALADPGDERARVGIGSETCVAGRRPSMAEPLGHDRGIDALRPDRRGESGRETAVPAREAAPNIRKEWLAAQATTAVLRVAGDAMAPSGRWGIGRLFAT